jgi:hypothetical protein
MMSRTGRISNAVPNRIQVLISLWLQLLGIVGIVVQKCLPHPQMVLFSPIVPDPLVFLMFVLWFGYGAENHKSEWSQNRICANTNFQNSNIVSHSSWYITVVFEYRSGRNALSEQERLFATMYYPGKGTYFFREKCVL